jgi:hypothetical protein
MSDLKDRLRTAVDEASALKSKLTMLQEEAEAAANALKTLTRERIPEIMDEVGVTKIKLDDGTTIDLRNQCTASIVDNEGAVAFLDANGFGGIVRTELKLIFAGTDRERATEAAEKLAGLGYECEGKTTVHPMTLKSWARERIENGEQLPPDCFSIFPFVEAVIKAGK